MPKFEFGKRPSLTPEESYRQLASHARILVNYVVACRTFNCDEIATQASEINQSLHQLRRQYPDSFTSDYEAVVDLLHMLLCALQIRLDVHQTPPTPTKNEPSRPKREPLDLISMRKRNTRHEPNQVLFLRHWYEVRLTKNGNQPVYLRDPDDLDYLLQRTNLTETQIRDWVSNERRRRKVVGRHHHRKYELPSEW